MRLRASAPTHGQRPPGHIGHDDEGDQQQQENPDHPVRSAQESMNAPGAVRFGRETACDTSAD